MAVGMSDLTNRDRTVLALAAAGKTNKEIGAALFLSEKTVKNYMSRIFDLLHVDNRTAAAALWHQYQPVDTDHLMQAARAAGFAEATALAAVREAAAAQAWDDAVNVLRAVNPYR